MLHHIKNEMHCIVKGGMAMPFHIEDRIARRLSIDIDIVTSKDEQSVDSVIEKIRKKSIVEKIERKVNPNPAVSLPLARYFVTYKLAHGVSGIIKVEVLHDFPDNVEKYTVKDGTEVFSFTCGDDIDIFDRGTLIGDKLTTLSFDTIGIPLQAGRGRKKRTGQITKHIYDIGTLLRNANLKVIEQAFKHYFIFVNYENALRGNKFAQQQIVADLADSLDSRLDSRKLSLSAQQKELFLSFKNQLLSQQNPYRTTEHIYDILIIRLLANYLRKVTNRSLTETEAAGLFLDDLSALKGISKMSVEEKNSKRSELLDHLNSGKTNKIRPPSAEHAFLLQKVLYTP